MANESKRSWRWLWVAATPLLIAAALFATCRRHAEPVDLVRLRAALLPPPRALGISPDGTLLLLQGESAAGYDLSVVEKESKRTLATLATGKRPRQAVWSPDGRRVAYAVEHGRAECELRLWDIASGRALRPLAPSTRIVTSPRWAPGGARLAYVVERADSRRLFSVDAEERGEAAEWAPDMTPKAGVAWSPDGARIATVLRSDSSAVTILGPARSTYAHTRGGWS